MLKYWVVGVGDLFDYRQVGDGKFDDGSWLAEAWLWDNLAEASGLTLSGERREKCNLCLSRVFWVF